MVQNVEDNPLKFPLWRTQSGILYKFVKPSIPNLSSPSDNWTMVDPRTKERSFFSVVMMFQHLVIWVSLRLSEKFIKMKADVNYVKHCTYCAQDKVEQKPPASLMGERLDITESFRALSLDYIGSLPPSRKGFCYIPIPDPHTRYQIPDTRHQTPDTRYQILDTRHQIPDTRYQIADTRNEIPDTRHQIPDKKITDTKYQIPDTRYHTPDTRYQTPHTRYQIPDTRHQIPDTRYQTPDTRHQIPDTRYQIPDTRHQISDTRYQILDTRYQIPDPHTRYQIPDTRHQTPDTRY
ncbi:unnamed protein product [Acanthoscelides obtectus]|uniref:Uncharacterized protein n=1 Tax=Acanthoscelides obtectus TaxID=200917 RepID=A0A9P0VQX3_ACAOB|nr:unnamed protein product [Acanthoscelides obtectus]CAK1688681.1 Polysialic acid O-acetyltransferase [Acanthoscelides obtectus]